MSRATLLPAFLPAPAAPLVGAVAAALLAGCTGGGSDAALGTAPEPALGVAPPTRLLASRAVDRNALEPIVTLSDGRSVPMSRVDGTDRWSGTVDVPVSSVLTVEIEWRVSLARGPLGLARASRRVEIDEVGTAVQLGASDYDYDTGLDADGDGVSNLDELEQSRNPFGDDATVVVVGAPDGDPDGGPDADPDADPDEGTDAPAPGGDPDAVIDVPPVPTPSVPVPDDEDDEDDEDDDDDEDEDLDDDAPADDEAVVDVYVPRVSRSDVPDIDGRGVVTGPDGRFGGEWSAAVQVDSSGRPLGVNNLMIDVDADAPDGTPWRRWAAMHDGEYLYVLVTVEDDGARIEDSATIWEDDSLEVFIDGDRSRNPFYGDDDDWHVLMGLLAPGTIRTSNSNDVEGWEPGPFSSGEGLELDFATGPGIGPDGLRRPRHEQDVYELRIELKSANIDVGRPFGFELQVNDDDDGGTRDSKWGWAHPSRGAIDVDFTYINPSYMGTLLLD